MNSEEASPTSSSYGLLAEEGTVDQVHLNAGLIRDNTSNGQLLPDGLAHQDGPYLWSAQFYELVVCLVYALVAFVVLCWVDDNVGPDERPIPFQFLEGSGEYVRNLMFNESFEHESVSYLALCLLGLWLPLTIQSLLCLCGERRKNDLHATVCAYLVAMTTNTIATNSVKLYVGYLRPIFYDQCQPDDEYQTCTVDTGNDIRKSFPSGHASMAFCGLTLLTLFIHARFGVASQRYYQRIGGGGGGIGSSTGEERQWIRETIQVGVGWARFASLLALAPMALALFIAASRVVDNKHFPADVAAGSVLGASISNYVHGLWFD